MTDIFISYSKADHTLALKLSAFLEAEGWNVWWDRNLSAGETYRDEIMRKLSAARAVIVIWTQSSVKSDWARAEAGRAKADGKLIPVKAPDLTYSDIPLPFGEMHTENLTATDLIRAAVVAQLSKPAVAPSALWLVTRTVRHQVLTWTGIIGGAITIFSSLRGLVNLADWARWIVSHWHEWTQAFWAATLLSWIGFRVHPAFVPPLSFTIFLVMVVIGTVLRTKMPAYPGGPSRITQSKVQVLKSIAARIGIYLICCVVFFAVAAVATLNQVGPNTMLALLITFAVAPLALIIWASQDRLQCFALAVFLLLFWIALAVVPLVPIAAGISDADHLALGASGIFSAMLVPVGVIAIESLAPVKSINQRLLFLAIGALLLVALNALSRLGLHHLLETTSPPL
jgi:TIR domain